MALISYTSKEVDQMARLMRAEALGEGELGMLMVGNVIVNRAIADCLTFKNTMTIESVIFQSPGGFSGINSKLFYSGATTTEKELALRNLNNETTNYITYYVQRGDNLYNLAREYNTTVNEIKKLNNLTSDLLSIGQSLLLPA